MISRYSPFLFDLLDFPVEVFDPPMGIYFFCDIIHSMANNQFQDIFVYTCSFCQSDERVPGIVRLMRHVQLVHYFVEPSPIFTIGQECTMSAAFIVEKVIAVHFSGSVIVLLYKFPDPWVDGDNSVLPGVCFQAAYNSPVIQINIIYLQYSKLLWAEPSVYANQYHICERYLDIVP